MNSRTKGARAERQVVKLFQEHGYSVQRNLQQFIAGGEDIRLPPNKGCGQYKIEVKHQEIPNLKAWWAQAQGQCKNEHEIPVLFFRSNYKPWQVKLRLHVANTDVDAIISVDDFFKIYKQSNGLSSN